MQNIIDTLGRFLTQTGFFQEDFTWGNLAMIAVACFLLYLAIGKKFEPLLLVPIAFGMLLTNIPGADIFHSEIFNGAHPNWEMLAETGGLIDYLYLGVKLGIYPSLIFMAVGAMTDFGPLLSRPSSLFLGAAAQLGIYVAFVFALVLGFAPNVAAAIAIIGGADGPTAIWLTTKLAPAFLPAIAIAAYSYMALIPMIQPPLMRLLTTKKEREIKMEQARTVSKKEKIIFPILVTVVCGLLIPDVVPLLGCLMLGNLFRECGVTERLSDTAQNAMCNIVTILLGVSVGATAKAQTFLTVETLMIVALGLGAFAFATIGGLLIGKLMCWLTKGKINPLIGSAGVSAVPMAARVSNVEGLKAQPGNYLLMHAMGPNVAGVIGSAVAAGFLLSIFQ